jgi:sec-independent protein translocase protein TatA
MGNKTLLLLLGMPGMPEMIIIGLVLLLLFGGKKIPELMKGLGQGISEYKKAKRDVDKELNSTR